MDTERIERIKALIAASHKRERDHARRFESNDQVRLNDLIILAEAWDFCCPYCLTPLDQVPAIQWEHAQTLSLGGHHSFDNVLICCAECNRRKCAKPLEKWLIQIGVDPEVWKATYSRALDQIVKNRIEGLQVYSQPIADHMLRQWEAALAGEPLDDPLTLTKLIHEEYLRTIYMQAFTLAAEVLAAHMANPPSHS